MPAKVYCSEVRHVSSALRPARVLKQLSRPPLDPDVLICMLTVFEDAEAVFGALRAGATGYLLKATPPAEVLEAVKDLHAGGSR